MEDKWYNIYDANCLGAAMNEWEENGTQMWSPAIFWCDEQHIKNMCNSDYPYNVEEIEYFDGFPNAKKIAMAYLKYSKQNITVRKIVSEA